MAGRAPILVVMLLAVTAACDAVPVVTRSEVADGPFRLQLTFPKAVWSAEEEIVAQASLSFAGPGGIDLGGSGGGLLSFSVVEVGGARAMGGASTADCRRHRLEAGQPIVSGLTKGVGFSAEDPNAAFYRAWVQDPVYRLPAGTWDIAVMASFLEGADCSGESHDLTTVVRIRVDG